MDVAYDQLIREAELVVCDFDGTLARLQVDWQGLKARLHAIAARAGHAWAFSSGYDRDLRELRSRAGLVLFEECCGVIAEAELAGFRAELVNKPLLAALRARGARPCGIFSANTHRALERIFEHEVWGGLRPALVGKEDVARGKPDPEGLLAVCAHFSVEPARALYLGDREIDLEAGRAAGVPTRHVDFG
jgi:phosphoglycolate phosphatase-like HAD superfamily hydrolase